MNREVDWLCSRVRRQMPISRPQRQPLETPLENPSVSLRPLLKKCNVKMDVRSGESASLPPSICPQLTLPCWTEPSAGTILKAKTKHVPFSSSLNHIQGLVP
ncbi:hypothetical protein SAMN02744124_01523 [Paenibacillus barengoltzii J12]|uniref:Uncharacterized protein n=1 Tax=Paenibacillus barengoltzii J12 TaxID=935846 RepID=A0ABY1LVP6_9BACL|nr:hypothetical protein SAMN02744124_01523 [Paenibacillus barengoltzii J12]